MKILHLSAASKETGAGKAAFITHHYLVTRGFDSEILFLKENSASRGLHSYFHESVIHKIKQKAISFLERLPLKFYPKRKHTIFSPALIGLPLRNHKLILNCDIIHIHWANHGFLDISEIEKWEKPIIWTLRDMWAFTGGCHHSFECEEYKRSCGNCPSLGSSRSTDLSSLVLKNKLENLNVDAIKWVAISTWMKKQAQSSKLLNGQDIDVIPSGVNGNAFSLLDKSLTRKELGLPLDKKIILVGANDIRETYKGFSFVLDVLKLLSFDYVVLTFGNTTFNKGEITQEFMDYGVCDTQMLNKLYSVSDVFLGPSIAEAMGKTFLEAQFNGLPVVCFENTGPEDIVIHKQTGYVAALRDLDDLHKGLMYCLNTTFSSASIREQAFKKFHIDQVCESYISLYEKCIIKK